MTDARNGATRNRVATHGWRDRDQVVGPHNTQARRNAPPPHSTKKDSYAGETPHAMQPLTAEPPTPA